MNRIPIPNPTPLGDDRLFLSGGYGEGSTIIQVSRDNDHWSVTETRDIPDYGSQIHPALLHDQNLYVNLNEDDAMKRGLACLDLNGDILWQTHTSPSIGRGNLIIADAMVISMGGGDGMLRLIQTDPSEYKELTAAVIFSNLKDNDNQIWAAMALSNGKLVVRNQNEMVCLDLVNP